MVSPRFSPPATSGSYKSAGLPNITGAITPNNYGYTYQKGFEGGATGTGAFIAENADYNAIGDIQGNTTTQLAKITFDASKSNNIYGASTTVQPSSFTTRFIIKY